MGDKKKIPTKKNIAFESLDSVELKKMVDVKAGTEVVQSKRNNMIEEKAKKITLPKEELIRVTVDLPKSEHKRLKILAMEKDLKLYQYVLQIIRAEIKRNP